MTDLAIWLLRWTIAGAALGAVVFVLEYVLEKSGRAASLQLYRIALVTALVAPAIAFAPPLLTFRTTPPVAYEAYRPAPRPPEAPYVKPRETADAPVAHNRDDAARGADI